MGEKKEREFENSMLHARLKLEKEDEIRKFRQDMDVRLAKWEASKNYELNFLEEEKQHQLFMLSLKEEEIEDSREKVRNCKREKRTQDFEHRRKLSLLLEA